MSSPTQPTPPSDPRPATQAQPLPPIGTGAPQQPPPIAPPPSHWTVFHEWWKGFQGIWTLATLVSGLITLISIGANAWINQWLRDTFKPAITFWEVLSATAPLAISVAILIRMMLGGSFKGLIQFMVVAVLVLGAAAWIAGTYGPPESAQEWQKIEELWKKLFDWKPGQPGLNPISLLYAAFFGTLGAYWNVYGAAMFFSSLLVGAFLGWLWGIADNEQVA